MAKMIWKTTLIFLGAIAVLGIILATAALLLDSKVIALNSAVLPISAIPAIAFLIWLSKEVRNPLIRAQNIVTGIWTIGAATIAAHLVTRVPVNLVTAVVSTAIIEVILLLTLYHVTRKLYSAGRRRNLAVATGKPESDSEVRSLANNADLAQATVLSIFVTTKLAIFMQSDIAPYLETATIRLVALTLGASMGLIWFNAGHNQTTIREFIKRSNSTDEQCNGNQ